MPTQLDQRYSFTFDDQVSSFDIFVNQGNRTADTDAKAVALMNAFSDLFIAIIGRTPMIQVRFQDSTYSYDTTDIGVVGQPEA
ncbi:hypothetical protein ACIF83_10135 [Streptomyces sp. NPDC085866]|uniref:hypothetical protein n=1 Tax=Streptomyces sp. NPDC085866 TaxID=3365736 RepID=UPI0037D0A8D6